MYQRAMHFLLTSARRWLEKPAALNHDAMSTELELERPGMLACCKEVIVLKLAGPNCAWTDGFFSSQSQIMAWPPHLARARMP